MAAAAAVPRPTPTSASRASPCVNRNPLALVPNPRDLADLLDTIAETSPTVLQRRADAVHRAAATTRGCGAGKVDFKSIKVCFSGAAPLLAETKRRFEELTGGRIVEGYSLTEAMMALRRQPGGGPEQDRLGRDAAARRGGAHRRRRGRRRPARRRGRRDPDPGAAADGRLLGRPGGDRRHASGPDDGERWLHTGDLGYLDDDGYLFIVDRKKDLIKTSGYQVWPREIEEVLAAHPAVGRGRRGRRARRGQGRGGQGLGRAAPRAGRPPTRSCGRSAASAWRRTRCRPPSSSGAELPKTMVGKVLRRALTEPGSAP